MFVRALVQEQRKQPLMKPSNPPAVPLRYRNARSKRVTRAAAR